jgi:hypothetical protein
VTTMSQSPGGDGPGLPPIEPPRTSVERLRKRLLGKRAWLTYAAVVIVAAAVILPFVLSSPPAPSALCHDGLVIAGAGDQAECVGLTDGSQSFVPADDGSQSFPSLAGIEREVYRENQSAGKSPGWVGVAYLLPIPLNQATSITLEDVVDQLSGAYAAQWEANHGTANGDGPKIKLYLVNEGSQEGQWQTAVNQTLAGTRNGRRVVAVAGLGQSIPQTYSAAKQLANARIAMFGATITADGLNGSRFRGLTRVAPTNTDEVEAALQFLTLLPRSARNAGMLVQDQAGGDDPYIQTWTQQVEQRYPEDGGRFVTQQPEMFDRTLPDEGDRFIQIALDICNDKPQVVFFAGRARDLELFIGALGSRTCPSTPVTVISGDDDLIDPATGTDGQYQSYASALSDSGVTLYSTALAHPDEWTSCGPVPPSQQGAALAFSAFKQIFTEQFHGAEAAEALQPGSAMLAQDAVMLAIHTIRLPADQQQPGNGQQQPYNYKTVTQLLNDLPGHPIPGASGLISISGDGPSKGDAVDKPIAIVQHEPDGTLACRDVEIPGARQTSGVR